MRRLLATVLIVSFVAPTGFAETPTSVNPRPLGLVRAELVPMAAQQPQQTPARRHWVARHPVLVGTMAGAGIGLGWLASESCRSSDYTCGGLVAFAVGTGAALGAGAGVIVGLFLR